MKRYVIPKAKIIQTQNLAPDVSLSHVMKLLKEYIWQFKQIFSHFGIQSLVEVGGCGLGACRLRRQLTTTLLLLSPGRQQSDG